MYKKIIFFSKKTLFCNYAVEILKKAFNSTDLLIEQGEVGTAFNEDLSLYKPDYIISFLSPWIIPDYMLKQTKIAAINFHPGSPRYPGTGCYNFALYEKSKTYGVTCHHMKAKVDTGDIVKVSYFPIYKNETVESLKLKSMIHLLYLFQNITDLIYSGKSLPKSNDYWERKPYTRKELNDLCKIDPFTMSKDEILNRIKSTTYPSAPGAYIDLNGNIFNYPVPNNKPIA
ncbi:formyltransferase family protein [Clostridium brassicae]|uniref:Formyltransferase family protein n=1 Tax=Clostridium brassicae TaxID=2999072 RepID=A0ABT4DFS8_9CLOT|nr:formyltransferase family protein [Clostridium brassicae]MCY6960066.1 formyltransferase family protein [Clostridium brassicae]